MSDSLKPPTARNLRLLKEHRGATWAEIARACEVGERVATYWAAEDGTVPTWVNIVKLAEFFDVEPHVFYMSNFDPEVYAITRETPPKRVPA